LSRKVNVEQVLLQRISRVRNILVEDGFFGKKVFHGIGSLGSGRKRHDECQNAIKNIRYSEHKPEFVNPIKLTNSWQAPNGIPVPFDVEF
jgi:hypothetical protein